MVFKLFWDYALNDELKCIKYNFMHFAFGNLHSSISEKTNLLKNDCYCDKKAIVNAQNTLIKKIFRVPRNSKKMQ